METAHPLVAGHFKFKSNKQTKRHGMMRHTVGATPRHCELAQAAPTDLITACITTRPSSDNATTRNTFISIWYHDNFIQ